MPIDYARRLTGTVRTTRVNTHLGVGLAFVAGIVTDIGLELGKLLYSNRTKIAGEPPVMADRARLALLAMLLAAFFSGGVIGALGFRAIGYSATIPLALVLLILAVVPAVDDVRRAIIEERGSDGQHRDRGPARGAASEQPGRRGRGRSQRNSPRRRGGQVRRPLGDER